jgi:hypothetical protein
MGGYANEVTLQLEMYTSTGGNVSQDLDWRLGGTIVSNSFFSSHGDPSWKGRRTVMLRVPGSKRIIGRSFFHQNYSDKFNRH